MISKSWQQECLFLRTACKALVINFAIDPKAKNIDIKFLIMLVNCLAGKLLTDYPAQLALQGCNFSLWH